jgi:RHS repeat-associated protein
VDNFSDPILSTEWEWYLPNIGPTYSLNANPGYLQLMVPPNDLYEHWISDDGAPQLRRSDMGSGDWAVETNFDINNSATDGWSQVILMVGFDRYDQLWFNVGSDDILYISRVGEESTSQVAISLPIRLRIEKSGIQFSFLYKPDSGDPVADALQPWTTLETRNVDRPVTYVGLEVRSLDVTTGSLSIDVDQFRLERFGSAPPTPYTESLPDSFEGNSLDASWNWYVPLTGPVYSLTALPGALRMSLPPGGFEHWIYTDDAPQLRRSDLGDQDWAIETELKGISGGETAGYFAALEVGFDQYDQIWFGMDQDGYLGSTRIGVDAPNSRLLTLPLFLRLEKHGQDYLFKYRSSPNGAWTVMPPAYYPGTPQYVGLIARVFSAGNQQLEIDWGSFQLERWPSSPSTLTPTMTTSPTVTLTPTLAFPTGPVTINYGYDKLNRLTEANYSDGRFYHYSYDQVGNRLTASDQYSTTAYVYDDANRLASVNGQPYTYDNNGNLLFNGVTTYAYDSANRLISASNSLGSTTYGYSGLGDRLQEITNGQTTTFTVDLAADLTQTLDDGTHAYLYGYGRIAQENITGSEYFLGDALGSVRQLADESGELILAKTYDPFGVQSASNGAGDTSYGFTGEQQSGDLVYLRARHYLPSIGRFLTRDTWGGDENQPMSYNSWLYGYGNPIDRTDPEGTQPAKSGISALVGDDTYYRFDITLDYIYDQMITNSRGKSAELMRMMLAQGTACEDYYSSSYPDAQLGSILGAYIIFFDHEKSGGDWDHKPKLRQMLGIGKSWNDRYFPIRGDDESEFFYDIWSNIHYGYVVLSIGFDRETLQFFPNAGIYFPILKGLLGQNDPGDEISTDIGVKLWQEHGYSLSKSDLHQAILANEKTYFSSQDVNGNGKIDKDEIGPVQGKLLPKGTKWSDWK